MGDLTSRRAAGEALRVADELTRLRALRTVQGTENSTRHRENSTGTAMDTTSHRENTYKAPLWTLQAPLWTPQATVRTRPGTLPRRNPLLRIHRHPHTTTLMPARIHPRTGIMMLNLVHRYRSALCTMSPIPAERFQPCDPLGRQVTRLTSRNPNSHFSLLALLLITWRETGFHLVSPLCTESSPSPYPLRLRWLARDRAPTEPQASLSRQKCTIESS
ncbi:hypothetical protein E6O75_ATG06683 [Venturia nashicola]|uniref:Uncharacterized protein n=1 Tax=Venturia nashicola TaxID=86259 RepID=A0A4Z1NX32_9PEZI|nr:hypothetical protein E6O75_ATG06683 [Venturia nashicola]